MGTGEGVLGREADHSSPFSVEAKNAWSCTSTPAIRPHRKGKGKVVPMLKHRAMKVYSGSGSIAPRILDLDTRRR